MIVWLASYPRSGNTLLRTVLKQTMGLSSYSDEDAIVEFTDQTNERLGHLPLEGPWEDFYDQATNSKEIFLVKTHQPPRDNQPAIYVVRDGRAATESYAAFCRSFQPDVKFCPSILELMLGDDHYGDWSSHFQDWTSRAEGSLLQLRFEDLVNANGQLLERVGSFIGIEGEVKSFDNPMEKLHLESPNFFRSGKTDWKISAQWGGELYSLFMALHGDLLLQLNYIELPEINAAMGSLDEILVRVCKLAKRGFSERNAWLYEAQLKEKVIQELLLGRERPIT